MSREPARVQFPEGMASPVPSASPAGGTSGGPRNLKQERTAQNFLRGCARLRMIQVGPRCQFSTLNSAHCASSGDLQTLTMDSG